MSIFPECSARPRRPVFPGVALVIGVLMASALVPSSNSTQAAVGAGSTTKVKVADRAGVPDNASAVVVNLTAVDPTGPGHIVAYPCGSTKPDASSLNYTPTNPVVANSAIVDVGTNGEICIYTTTPTDVLVDINGWFPNNSDYTSRNPQRLLDTRTGTSPGKGSTTKVKVADRAGVPDNASAVVVNLTAVDPTGPGHIVAYPCGSTKPDASSLNYTPTNPVVANSAIVDVGTNGEICIYTTTPTDVLVDINGWFPNNSDYTSRNPQRLLDTRTTGGGGSGGGGSGGGGSGGGGSGGGGSGGGGSGGTPPDTTGAQFVETFDDDTGLDQFDLHVFHRNPDVHDFDGFSGGSWTGDHDESCGTPDTQRQLRFNASDSQAQRRANSFYTCRNHLMTSMGDVDGYSIAAFAPKPVFDDVDEVSFEVNLTDLGTRQWWKVGVLSTSKCPELDLRCMYSDVGSADIADLDGPGRLIATWSGGASLAGLHGLAIGGRQVETGVNPTPNDKATRHSVSLVDNGNGTVTFTVAGRSGTTSGSFPACPCRVVFYDHNYTPDKSETGHPIGHTWHWDNIIVK